MSDDFEDLLRRWLRDRSRTDRSTLQALAGNVAVLPPRRRRRIPLLPIAASIVVLLGLLVLASPRFGSVGEQPTETPGSVPPPSESGLVAGVPDSAHPTESASPVLPDPAAFAGSPWLARCGGAGEALTAFEVPRARDIWLFLPAMLGAPGLERDEPAFVLVYRNRYPGMVRRAAPEPGTTLGPEPTLAPNHHDMCVIVGPVTGAGTFGIYGDVSLDRFDPSPDGVAPAPPPTYDAPPFPVWPGIAWSDDTNAPADPLVLAAFTGPASCGWDEAAFLEIGWPLGSQALTIDNVRRYIRDPKSIFQEGYVILDRLDLAATLPSDASFAGYRSGDIELWTSPSTIDRAVFLRWPDHVERWPRMEYVSTCG